MTGKPRGRSGGRKSTWNHPTKMMRLPEKFEDAIVAYARKLDSGEAIDFDSKLNDAIAATLLELKPSERRSASALFKRLLRQLS